MWPCSIRFPVVEIEKVSATRIYTCWMLWFPVRIKTSMATRLHGHHHAGKHSVLSTMVAAAEQQSPRSWTIVACIYISLPQALLISHFPS